MYGRRYVNTTAVKSKISFTDGDKGVLRYRGYPIEQLAERSNFLEVCVSGSLPITTLLLMDFRQPARAGNYHPCFS